MIAHGEQVFPRIKEKCSPKHWFASEDIVSLEELIGRLRRLKENVGFIANRVTAIQAGLDSWQAEQINRKLYYLSFLSIIFLPLSVVTGGKILSALAILYFKAYWKGECLRWVLSACDTCMSLANLAKLTCTQLPNF